jgi:hypothetical protein
MESDQKKDAIYKHLVISTRQRTILPSEGSDDFLDEVVTNFVFMAFCAD